MLKELWRKLGADFLQADSSYGDCSNGAFACNDSAEFRILPHITHTGEFHLERLTMLLKSRYGKSTEAEGDNAVRDLIVFAARIQDQDVQKELLLFYLNCSPKVQEYLRSDEVLGTSHFLSR